jgi:aminotransferase in exopolysaccharide biosynthesis
MGDFIPLSVPNLSLDILKNVRETIETGWVSTGGRFIKEFEEKLAKYVGVPKAVSCQSGTSGLHLALKVLGVEAGDEVIVPTLTFVAAVNPIKYLGAEPVFMDCDHSLNMDVHKVYEFLNNECRIFNGHVINKLTNRIIKAIVVVHVFGNPADMEKLMEIRKKYNLKILEDATEGLGSYYKEGIYKGKHCGTIGDIGVYSFNANKIITTGGGGMVVSNNLDLIDEIDYLSQQAKNDSFYFVHNKIGYNYRMTNIQAAFGTDQIDRLEDFINIKIKNYGVYKKNIEKIEGLKVLPFRDDTRSNHWFYSVIVDKILYGVDRDSLLDSLNRNKIQSRPLWKLIHKQIPYKKNQIYKIENAHFYEENLINIPCSTNLVSQDILKVIEFLRNQHKYLQ